MLWVNDGSLQYLKHMLKIWWVMNYLQFYAEKLCLSEPMVGSISPVLFEIGIPNLVCGYILGYGLLHIVFRLRCIVFGSP